LTACRALARLKQDERIAAPEDLVAARVDARSVRRRLATAIATGCGST
jgi:hypothetical protein